MTTYGKRKKALKSTFAVLRDDDEAAPSNEKPFHAPRFPRGKHKASSHQYQTRHDDDSLDELAAAALLKEIPQKPIGHSSLRETNSNDSVPRPADQSKRQPLLAKTTNAKIPAEDRSQGHKAREDSMQTRPTLVENTQRLKLAKGSSLDPAATATSTRNDPVALNSKITNLMQQAAAQEAESRRTEAIYDNEVAKPSPRQRAKKALAKATQAFKHRLSSANNDSQRPDRIMAHYHAGGSDYVLASNSGSTEDMLNKRVSCRKIEGTNLGNPKIQALTGDGNVPRKPLTIYETMRSRTLESSYSEGYQSSDGMNTDSESNTQSRSDHGNRFDSSGHIIQEEAGQEACSDQRRSIFSSQISKLQQNPHMFSVDTTKLSSSPDATSTPTGRLHDRDSSGRNDDCGSAQRHIGDGLTFPGPREEDTETPSSHPVFVSDGNQSAKKRESRSDPPSPTLPLTKKAKIALGAPADEAEIVTNAMSGLDTKKDQEPLSNKSQDDSKKTGSGKGDRKKGLKIFEVGKGKETETVEGEKPVKQSRPKGLMGKRTSFSRPASRLLCFESKPGSGKFSKLDQDEMDVDELS